MAFSNSSWVVTGRTHESNRGHPLPVPGGNTKEQQRAGGGGGVGGRGWADDGVAPEILGDPLLRRGDPGLAQPHQLPRPRDPGHNGGGADR